MPSEVEVANIALGHIGSDAQISSVTPPDGSKEAGYASRFIALSRRELLVGHEWRFSVKRAALVKLVTNPSTRWAFAYTKPSDCIKPRRILTDSYFQGSVFTAPESYPPAGGLRMDDEKGAEFQTEGDIIYTNEDDAVLVYQIDVTNFNKWTPDAYSALGYLLASYMAGPIIRGKSGARTAQDLRSLALGLASQAAASDANNGQETHDYQPASVSAR